MLKIKTLQLGKPFGGWAFPVGKFRKPCEMSNSRTLSASRVRTGWVSKLRLGLLLLLLPILKGRDCDEGRGAEKQIPPKTMQHASWQAERQTSTNFACKQREEQQRPKWRNKKKKTKNKNGGGHKGKFPFIRLVANVQKIKCKKFKWIFVQPNSSRLLCILCFVCWSDNKIQNFSRSNRATWSGDFGGCRMAGHKSANQRC